jgi:leader peptidase (prepilin peptidase) / N-methyltransferase
VVVPLAIAGLGFACLGVAAERLASVWPSHGASRRGAGIRTALLGAASGAAAASIVARSTLPWWVTAAYLAAVAVLVVLSATDLEQRRLPHVLLDPLILASLAFVPFNPAVAPVSAVAGALGSIAVLMVLRLLVRGGLARGDLLLMIPIGLLLGFPAAFTALWAAALAAAASSLVLLAGRRVGMRSYIPFGPFLVLGMVVALVLDDRVLTLAR